MSRRTLLVVLAVAVVVSSLATWLAAEQIRSPAEAAARTAPPPASPILVPVVEQELSTRVVTRGTAHYGSPRKLRVTRSSLKGSPRVVTKVVRAGTVVSAGEVVAAISGRPVFVLPGRQPSYRDLGPGMRGPDVRQLERALQKVGLAPGPVDGTYDAATEQAVTALYHRNRYEPLTATESAVAAARPPEAELVPGSLAHGGVQVPADEVVFVESAPLRITKLHVAPGDAPLGPLATVTDSDVVIDGFVRVEQSNRLRVGGKVLVDEPALGIDTEGRVSDVASRPGTNGADGFHVHFEVAVPRPPRTLVGASVRLEVPIKSTRSAQLTVPVTAVSLGPDGGARVQRAVGDRLEFVPVQTGFSADGYVTVEPRSGELAAGDEVVVGFERRRAR
jgi:peptidoglycan hydrolase-like protein with peptidoglycan-binding domain